MFTRIDVERAKAHMSVKELATAAGMKYDTLLSKLNGRTEFTRKEMLHVQAAFSNKVPLEELFSTDSDLKIRLEKK
ncbi:MAG TPA: hypothetical protein DG942_06280 [Ruminococcaceae bacterium]|jgi:transcriptional regulator with XRE-family HTH domain|nr:hypothetical protein [Oscillospiraceae bacterium]